MAAGVVYEKEREVLAFIARYQQERHEGPTLSEVARATGRASSATIAFLLRSLVQKGFVQKAQGFSRLWTIPDQELVALLTGGQAEVPIPVLGVVSSGKLISLQQATLLSISVPGNYLSGNNVASAYHIRGSNFEHAGILHNDYLVVERPSQLQAGEVVLAIVDNKQTSTVSRYYTDSADQIKLVPLNQLSAPHVPDPLSVKILGRVKTLMRVC